MSGLLRQLASIADAAPDRMAIACGDTEMTFRELHNESNAYAKRFAQQNSPIVVLALPGGPQMLAAELGAIAAGAVAVPISEKTTAFEMAGVLSLLSPDVIVVQREDRHGPILSALTETADVVTSPNDSPRLTRTSASTFPDGTCMVQLTSGSTGRPKGVCITEANLVANLEANADHLASFGSRPVFCPTPQFHAMGGSVVIEHVLAGRGVVVSNRFMPGNDVRSMATYGVGAIIAGPGYYRLMLKLGVLSAERLPNLTSATLGSALTDSDLIADLQSKFPRIGVHVRYGLSESVGALARLDLNPGEPLHAPGLVGPLINGTFSVPLSPPGTDEPQEIVVSSACNAPAQLVDRNIWQPLLDSHGHLATGDVGFADHKGLHIRGRLSAFMKVNGYRVNPFEIEAALQTLPGVQEAVVVGPDDAVSGQRIVACLEQGPGPRIAEPPALLSTCGELLAPYKLPHLFIVFDDLPRTPSGKPDRSRILEVASQHACG